MRRVAVAIWLGLSVAAGAPIASAGDAVPLSAEQVKARWHGRLDRTKFSSRVHLSMNLGGVVEERELVVWRADEGGGSERVMVRFEAPPNLRKVSVLFLEQVDRPNDYFLYQPDLRRVRRIPQASADEDVFGIDLEFVGFGVAQSQPTETERMTEELVDGRATYRLEERAASENARFDERTTWIDAGTFIPMRTEHRRRGAVRMIARTTRIESVQGIETPVEMHFESPRDKRSVKLQVTAVDYRSAIPEEYFTTLALIRSRTLDER